MCGVVFGVWFWLLEGEKMKEGQEVGWEDLHLAAFFLPRRERRARPEDAHWHWQEHKDALATRCFVVAGCVGGLGWGDVSSLSP